MRRKIAMLALLGGLVAGLGCRHIAGKSDCGYHPSNYVIGPPSPPYPAAPVAAVVIPPAVPLAKDKIPEPMPDMEKEKDKDKLPEIKKPKNSDN